MLDQPIAPEAETKEDGTGRRIGIVSQIDEQRLCEGFKDVWCALIQRRMPQPDPAALILEAPFTSVPDMAEMHYPGSGALAAKFDNQWPSLKRAKQVDVPLLVLHGTNDELIPIEMGRQIYAAAPSREKSFLTVSGGGHTDLWRPDTLPRLWHFVDQFAFR